MWPQKNQTGYTVVETLMVIAVMGMIFASTSIMIRGQIAKYQYRENMQQLEQNIKVIINSVSNGTFGAPSELDPAATGISDTMLIGRRFWFCADNAPASMTFCHPPIAPNAPDGNIMHIETVVRDSTLPAIPPAVPAPFAPSYKGDNPKTIPNGLKFIGYKSLDASGNVAAGPGSPEFGTSILFRKDTGDAVDSIMDNNKGIQFYSRDGYNHLTHSFSTVNGGNGFLLCFEGIQKGSIQLGTATLGTNIVMNLLDERCDW
jgi:type II secretory pathway pseudopilin PulG